MPDVQEMSFRGSPFKVVRLDTYPSHASIASFLAEQDVREAFWDVGPGESVLDIGASFGPYALTALASGAKFVWAWSPQGHAGETEQEVLQQSLALNGWSDRAVIYGSGLYSRPGFLNTVTQELTDSVDDEFLARTEGNVIRVEPLDTWAGRELREGERVDWMKLDVEGAELDILTSGEAMIRRFRPKILVENHNCVRPTMGQEVNSFLTGLGYRVAGTISHNQDISHSLHVM